MRVTACVTDNRPKAGSVVVVWCGEVWKSISAQVYYLDRPPTPVSSTLWGSRLAPPFAVDLIPRNATGFSGNLIQSEDGIGREYQTHGNRQERR